VDLRRRKLQVSAGESIMRSFITLYASPNVISAVKSRRMRWAKHVARMGEMKNAYEILAGKPDG
jgi:hypothetical protein